MTYQEQLENPLWKAKRYRIIAGSQWKCKHCENQNILARSKEAIIKGIREMGSREYSTQVTSTIRKYEIRLTFSDDEKIHTVFLNTYGILSQRDFSSYTLYLAADQTVQKGGISINAITNRWPDGTLQWKHVRGLQVHHPYYQEGAMPWDYPDRDLTTLCWICHEKLHAKEKIPFLDRDGLEKGSLTPCHRCHSAGYFPEYNHVEDGICFRCRGARYEEHIIHADKK